MAASKKKGGARKRTHTKKITPKGQKVVAVDAKVSGLFIA